MKKLIFSLAAATAIGAAAPAAAQYGYQQNNYPAQQNGYGYQGNVNAGGAVGVQNRIAQLDSRFEAGIQSGLISRTEAQNIRPQLRQLRQLERQYSMNGLTQQERQDLQQRIRYVRQQLRAADGGAGGQYAAWENDNYYGQNQGYNQGGYSDQNQGYGQGGYYGQNQGYGGQNQGYYGQGGPYEEVNEVCRTRSSGLGGILGTILGAGDNCLSVGERVRGSLPAVPYQYQGQFRDGGGYYHRYVDGRVVQIDARTQTVVRIYDMQN
ncbi:MAG TPA: hypothetical protein VF631_13035 [Allosphingosinicella sp.]|jgi:hypothetical protein|uniref:hypothetical protein n=1 Tax=Allosphingosinicella sp. TaxID=2823234 RepID=UPI002F294E84